MPISPTRHSSPSASRFGLSSCGSRAATAITASAAVALKDARLPVSRIMFPSSRTADYVRVKAVQYRGGREVRLAGGAVGLRHRRQTLHAGARPRGNARDVGADGGGPRYALPLRSL